MKIAEIKAAILDQFPGSVLESEDLAENQLELKADQWFEIATFMKEDPNLSFDQFESDYFATMPYEGIDVLGPFVGKRWTPVNNWSNVNNVYTGCDYDSVHNDSNSFELNTDISVTCILEISNQAPIIVWHQPFDDEEFASGSEVIFDASVSSDLDNE